MFNKKILKCFSRMMFMATILTSAGLFTACSDEGTPDEPGTDRDEHGVFVVCEGNYGASSSSLTWANMQGNIYLNEIFRKANNVPLGSQAQSMTIHDDDGWVVVCDSHIIFKIDLDDYEEEGRTQFVRCRLSDHTFAPDAGDQF